MDKKISGILLSAGKSERMGEMKALLPIKDKVVIEKLIEKVNTVLENSKTYTLKEFFSDLGCNSLVS